MKINFTIQFLHRYQQNIMVKKKTVHPKIEFFYVLDESLLLLKCGW